MKQTKLTKYPPKHSKSLREKESKIILSPRGKDRVVAWELIEEDSEKKNKMNNKVWSPGGNSNKWGYEGHKRNAVEYIILTQKRQLVDSAEIQIQIEKEKKAKNQTEEESQL